MRRHPLGHHLASSGCLPQVWLQDRVLDLPSADHIGLYSRDHLRCLDHHQELKRTPLGGSIQKEIKCACIIKKMGPFMPQLMMIHIAD
ncbi:hypothetical protein NL676_023174 [Syzygium grande]|nr:hypothetical protein NL676_023174 [Syzygium grande]